MTTRFSNSRICVALLAALAVLALVPAAFAQASRLEWAEQPKLIDCGAGTVPCFRLTLNVVDERGGVAPVELPEDPLAAGVVGVRMDEHDGDPFYMAGEAAAERRGRVAMVLVDVSGSMNNTMPDGRTRFDVSKVAALNFLEGFEAGADRVAIVPFASRRVAETIRSSSFATSWEQARQQVVDLPLPETRNNTGLYSAISYGLDRIERELEQAPGTPEALLLVMTDGENDVRAGDDPELLTGPEGLSQVEEKVASKGVQVIAVGFGDPQLLNEPALRRVSSRAYITDNPGELTRIFGEAREMLNSRLRITTRCPDPWRSRSDLAGQPIRFRVNLQLAGETTLYSTERIWNPPQMSIPLPVDECTEEEKTAYIESPSGPGTGTNFRPLLVFIGLSLLLALLWFVVPRFVWRPSYVEEAAAVKPDRFAMTSRTKVGGYQGYPGSVGEPTGFGRKPPPQGRSAEDRTVVRPRDGSKTRLN